MDSGLAFEEKAFLSADRLTVWRTDSAAMMLARQSILALCQERCCFKMSENLLEFGMVCVVVKLALCYVFQRILFFVVYESDFVQSFDGKNLWIITSTPPLNL